MNGTHKETSSTAQRVIGLLQDHVELGTLECHYESSQTRRRVCAIFLGVVFGLTAFVFVQVAMIQGLLRAGLPLWAFSLLAAAFYGTLAGTIYHRWGRRDPRAGAPFQASGEELKRNLQWIRQNLS